MHAAIFFLVLFVGLALMFMAASQGVVGSVLLILAVIVLILVMKRNRDLYKHNFNKYDENALVIQNVQRGGVIRLTHVDGQTGTLDLKVLARHLYMEGDYSWFELECINSNGEKFWIDVDDDDELVVSVVIAKPQRSDIHFSNTLANIDEEESGTASYKGKTYRYTDSGNAVFYKYSDDKHKESLYYYDFKRSDRYLLSVEVWKNSTGKDDIQYFISQIIKPASITVFSTKGES